MSEDMVKDGYQHIMNIDESSVAVHMMSRKYEGIPHLKYIRMDVRDMSVFSDGSFDCVLDKGTLDSLMCGTDAPTSAAQMLGEVTRILKTGGVYMLITYGDPSMRMPHLNIPEYGWQVVLFIIPKPRYEKQANYPSTRSFVEPVPLTEKGLLPPDFFLEEKDTHYMYVCKKMDEDWISRTMPSVNLLN